MIPPRRLPPLPTPYYQDEWVTIYHGDCRKIIPSLYRFDLLLTDPPYGIKVDSTMAKQSGKQHGNAAAPKGIYEATNWDGETPTREWLECIRAKAEHSIIWGGNYFELPPTRCLLLWDKENGENQFADAEVAWTNLDKPVRLKRHMWNGMLRKGGEERLGHPTQKPLDVMLWCILQAPDDVTTILDPYVGSGTTLRAAKDLKRRAVGIEMDEKFCKMAKKRLLQETLL